MSRVLIFDGPEVDDLDGDLLFGLLVDAFEHARAEALADEVSQPVGIVLDLLPHFVVVGAEAHSQRFFLSKC